MSFRLLSVVLIPLTIATAVRSLNQADDTCSPAVLAAMSPRARKLAEKQSAIDLKNDRFTPQISNDNHERVPGLGRVVLGERIAQGRYANVFTLASHPKFVIKYETNCSRLKLSVHPLLMDFWLGVLAADADVAARPRFVSPAALLQGQSSVKISFAMGNTSWDQCVTRGGVVRFMVIERMGACAATRTRGIPDFRAGIEAGTHVFYLLMKLHRAGVFHGDIHAGNVCESRTKPGFFRLIDFGHGGFVEAETDDQSPNPMGVHSRLTAWQLAGKPFARRDDIYKSIELMARIAIGPGMWRVPEQLAENNSTSLIIWKQSGSPFVPSPELSAFDNLRHLTSGAQLFIKRTLSEIVKMARARDSVHTPIPYGPIIAHIHSILPVLESAAPPVTPISDSETAASISVRTALSTTATASPMTPTGIPSRAEAPFGVTASLVGSRGGRWRSLTGRGSKGPSKQMPSAPPDEEDATPDYVIRRGWCSILRLRRRRRHGNKRLIHPLDLDLHS